MALLWVAVPERLLRELERLLPVRERRFRYPGRKRYPDRLCLEGILTVLRWGIPWAELPRRPGYPSGQTCWRRFEEWQRAGVWEQLVAVLVEQLRQADLIEWERALADSTIVPAKRGAARSAKARLIAAAPPASCTSPATATAHRSQSG